MSTLRSSTRPWWIKEPSPFAGTPQDEGLKAAMRSAPSIYRHHRRHHNRQELYPLPIQSSSVSWANSKKDLSATRAQGFVGQPSRLLLVPKSRRFRRHRVHCADESRKDATSLAEIYNRMVQPVSPRTKETYNYATDKIYYSRNIAGVHCVSSPSGPNRRPHVDGGRFETISQTCRLPLRSRYA